ncbi:MAG: hypothetical protein GY758_04145 [Fuerstiella sp.]|nr:hypothetical protein [Fuerstiella sp.]MCP4512336.1 hypothetical protein [Fuerstiella sp.]
MSDTGHIFPLTLSNFEHYAFCDDSPEYPMVIVLRTPFEGTLDESAFESALRETLVDNPLLRAVIDESGWRMKWRLLKDHEPSITIVRCDREFPPVNCRSRWINLAQQSGVVFDLRLCATRGVLISHFHHACTDGIGAIRFLGDVFARYGQLTVASEDDRPTVRRPDPNVLLKRGSLHMPDNRSAPILHTLLETCRLLFRKSYRFLRQSPLPVTNEDGENIVHTEVLSRATVKQLKKWAAARGVSTNDLCLMVSLQQMADWTATDPTARPNDLFRILMPVSMRTPDHDEISAANVVSYVFHSYRRRQIRHTESLLAAIHHKSHQMLNRNEGAAMLRGFALTRWIPGLFDLSRKLQPDFASAVVTNVGEVRRLFENRFPLKQGKAVAGNVIIQSIDGVAPVRSNTNVTIAFGTYGGELFVHLNRNTRLFSKAEAEKLLAKLADRLVALVRTSELHIGDGVSCSQKNVQGQEPLSSMPELPAVASDPQVHM